MSQLGLHKKPKEEVYLFYVEGGQISHDFKSNSLIIVVFPVNLYNVEI